MSNLSCVPKTICDITENLVNKWSPVVWVSDGLSERRPLSFSVFKKYMPHKQSKNIVFGYLCQNFLMIYHYRVKNQIIPSIFQVISSMVLPSLNYDCLKTIHLKRAQVSSRVL